MAGATYIFVVSLLAACAALPTKVDPVIVKLDPEERYQYMRDGEGTPHLVDLWMKASDVMEAARFAPDQENIYHLFTRDNPTVSQPMMLDNEGLLRSTNYDPNRRTIVIVHGWLDTVTSPVNVVLVPAFLSAEDVNVIVVDWSIGAGTANYAVAAVNTITSGRSVARFINWLNTITGASLEKYHVVGHSLGAHQAGVIGRNVDGDIAYITGLDPAYPLFHHVANVHKLQASDASYTEVIHTNAGLFGYLTPIGHTDFYPNGGINMPGCNNNDCDHDRCIFYFAESLTSDGFTGTRCSSFATAMAGVCFLSGNLNMGGLVPKTGQSGIFHFETNAEPPFARG